MQKYELADRCEKDGWIYQVRKQTTCAKEDCKCHSGEYHDWEYVFEKRKHKASSTWQCIGLKSDVGFPPINPQHKLSDEEITANIIKEVDERIENIKKERNLNGSPIALTELEIMHTELFMLKYLKYHVYKSAKSLLTKSRKDTSDVFKKLYDTIQRLKNSLGNLSDEPKLEESSIKPEKSKSYTELLHSL